MRFSSLYRFGELDVGTTCQEAHRINKVNIVELANVRDDVAAFTAPEAMPGLRNGIYFAGGRFLLMERAAAPEILAALAHHRAFGEELNQIVRFTNLAYVLVGKDCCSPFYLPVQQNQRHQASMRPLDAG